MLTLVLGAVSPFSLLSNLSLSLSLSLSLLSSYELLVCRVRLTDPN